MRKVVYLLVAMLLLGKPDAGSACKFCAGSKPGKGGPQEQLYEQASTVFVGHVICTEEAEPLREYEIVSPIPMIEVTLRIKEVLARKRR
jgi:hypothetical protein